MRKRGNKRDRARQPHGGSVITNYETIMRGGAASTGDYGARHPYVPAIGHFATAGGMRIG